MLPLGGKLGVIVTRKKFLWYQTERFAPVTWEAWIVFKPPVLDFQAWAVASGKINEFPNDKARWKTNFRCALNNLSVRFKMLQDNSKNSDDPHKVYEIINSGCKAIPICSSPVLRRVCMPTCPLLPQTTTKACPHSPPRRIPTWLRISTNLLWSVCHSHLRCGITLSLLSFSSLY